MFKKGRFQVSTLMFKKGKSKFMVIKGKEMSYLTKGLPKIESLSSQLTFENKKKTGTTHVFAGQESF